MRVGYARVSSKSQNLARQLYTLKKDNCKKIFAEKVSGKNTNRPELHKMLNFIHQDDIVEVSAIDRLGRNRDDLIDILHTIKHKKASLDIANFDMITPPVRHKGESDNQFRERQNTYNFMSSMLINLLTYIAETERREIKERQKQGIQRAKHRGVYKGRLTVYSMDNKDLRGAFNDYFNRNKNHMSVSRIAKIHGMSRSTLYKKLKKYKPKSYNLQFDTMK